MKSTAYIFILIAFLVVCNFIAIYSVIKMKSEKDNSISTLYPYVQKYSFLKSNIESNILFSVSRIKNAQVTAFRNQSSMLSDLFGSETERLFILRISDRYCSSCGFCRGRRYASDAGSHKPCQGRQCANHRRRQQNRPSYGKPAADKAAAFQLRSCRRRMGRPDADDRHICKKTPQPGQTA